MLVPSLLLSLAMLESPLKLDTPAPPAVMPIGAVAACDAKLRLAGEKAERAARRARPVRGLPESYGKSFRSLDGYLVHLQCHAAPVDGAWWLEIRPGLYRHMTTATNAKPELATRAQLMRRYGFKR